MNIPPQVNYIIQTLEAAGYEAYIVGGCVRDSLRGIAPKDWDITTSATPAEAKGLFSRTIDTGIQHGTITVLVDKLPFEVTTYRIDGEYLDSRRPATVAFTANITEDLSRRDFTMNAIAYNPTQGFCDPFHGQADIQGGFIRCVGNPLHRFTEDALRMLRAIRFAGTTGFTICPQILSAITTLALNICHVSPERIHDELVKLVAGEYFTAISHLKTTGLETHILNGQGFNIVETAPAIMPLRMAMLLPYPADACEKPLRNLRFDNKSIKEIIHYKRLIEIGTLPSTPYEIKKILRYTPQEIFFNYFGTQNMATDIINNGECFTMKDLAITGKELGLPEGKAVGEMLEYLLDRVMQEPGLNTKEQLLQMV